MTRLRAVIPLLMAGCGVVAWAQQTPAEDKTMSEDAMKGPELYQTYCAACHGVDGRGNGPAAAALKGRLPDLRFLSKNSGGAFPLMKVQQVITGDNVVIAHGSRDMPVYGDMFREVKRDEMFVKQRIALLTGYIESLQKK